MTMNRADFAEHLAKDRRLVVLRVLEQSTGYQANEYIVHSLLQDFGHDVSEDLLGTDLAWLEEQGLVKLRTVATVRIAQLAGRGLDVARGRATVPGINRPRPE